jgi:hypothetical protein
MVPQSFSITNNLNISERQIDSQIELSDINLDTIYLNVFDKTSIDYNQTSVLLDLLGVAVVNNGQYEKELVKIIDSISLNNDDWIILGMPSQWPEFSEVHNFDVSIEYVGADEYFQGIMQFNAELANINDQNDLEDIFKIKDLGQLTNPNSDSVIDKLKVINGRNDIDNSKLKLTNVTYEGCDIVPSDLHYFSGMVHVIYNVSSNLGWTFTSKQLRTDAYNSSQNMYDVAEFDLFAGLGKDAFLRTYNSIHFSVSGYTWDNKNGQDDFNVQTGPEQIGHTTIGKTEINLNGEVTTLINRSYSNVNSMSSDVGFSASWYGDTFKIVYSFHTHSYATAWNALWARAEAQYTLFDYYLVK